MKIKQLLRCAKVGDKKTQGEICEGEHFVVRKHGGKRNHTGHKRKSFYIKLDETESLAHTIAKKRSAKKRFFKLAGDFFLGPVWQLQLRLQSVTITS